MRNSIEQRLDVGYEGSGEAELFLSYNTSTFPSSNCSSARLTGAHSEGQTETKAKRIEYRRPSGTTDVSTPITSPPQSLQL